MQTLYVATTLCRPMILGRDWLKGNKAYMSFNPVMLKLGGKEIPLENCMNKESIVVTIEDLVIRPLKRLFKQVGRPVGTAGGEIARLN